MTDYDRIKNEWNNFIDEIADYNICGDPMPQIWEVDQLLHKSWRCQKEKQYYKSFDMGRRAIHYCRILYSEITLRMYQNLACCGCFYEAFALLSLSIKASGATRLTPFGCEELTNQGLHMKKLIDAVIAHHNTGDTSKIEEYLKFIQNDEWFELDIDSTLLTIELEILKNVMIREGYIR